MKKIIRWLPLAVWLVNVLAVMLSYFTDMMWAVFPLFAVLFIVWSPAVMRIRRCTREGKRLFQKKPPAWVLAAAVVSGLYTFINFIVCAVQIREGGPMVMGRMFTGHMLVFTGIAMYTLWPETEKPDRDDAEGGGSG